MDYSKNHRLIVEDLMNGKFILQTDEIFEELKEKENFYASFFKASFGYELRLTQDYAYIISGESNETLSRDISIFFAILCYELDKDGKNFLDLLQYSEFDMETIENYFTNSSYIDLIQSNKQLKDTDSRRQLINTMSRRNIIDKVNEDRFSFTTAFRVFIDFANELAKGKMGEQNVSLN